MLGRYGGEVRERDIGLEDVWGYENFLPDGIDPPQSQISKS